MIVYCAFIDYRKACDSFDRSYLWQKLLSYNVNGKICHVIKNMYAMGLNLASRRIIKFSVYFPPNIRVRQGVNISQLLFAFFY